MTRSRRQGELFDRAECHPDGAQWPEPDSIYLAVLTLRTDGRRVWRAGSHRHLVDGDLITTPRLIQLGGTAWLAIAKRSDFGTPARNRLTDLHKEFEGAAARMIPKPAAKKETTNDSENAGRRRSQGAERKV